MASEDDDAMDADAYEGDDLDEGDLSQGSEAGATTAPAPAVNPTLARAQGAVGPLQPIMPSTITGASSLLPPPSAQRQLTGGTAAADKMADMGIAAPPAAADAEEVSVSAGPASSAAAPAVGAAATEAAESESESEVEDDRTDEQKAKDKLAEDTAAEIKRVEDEGYTFSKATCWAAASAYLDAKALFDDEGLDITICASAKKKIGLTAVSAKIAELRAAQEEKRADGQMVAHGESQFKIGSEDEEEEDEEEEEEQSGDEDWSGYTIAQLTIELGESKAQLEIKQGLAAIGPVLSVVKKWNQVLKDEKKTKPPEEYQLLKSEITVVKDFFTKDIREQGFNQKQYQMLSEMAAAEVEKAKLPGEIKAATKKVKGLEAAVEDIIIKKGEDKTLDQLAKVQKRAVALAASSSGTPKKRKTR